MADDKQVKKQPPPLLPRATTTTATKKKQPPPSLLKRLHLCLLRELADFKVPSLVAALYFACCYGGLAAYNHYRDSQVPPPLPTWVVQSYVLKGADAVDAAVGLQRGQMWCSALQGAAAALALLLLAVRRHGGGLRLRALALTALVASAANHWMNARLLGILRTDNPGNRPLACRRGRGHLHQPDTEPAWLPGLPPGRRRVLVARPPPGKQASIRRACREDRSCATCRRSRVPWISLNN